MSGPKGDSYVVSSEDYNSFPQEWVSTKRQCSIKDLRKARLRLTVPLPPLSQRSTKDNWTSERLVDEASTDETSPATLRVLAGSPRYLLS